MKKSLLLIIFVLALPLLGIAVESDSFKNLAGSKEEMNAMRLPNAETVGVRSKSAMLPVRFQNGKWTVDVPVETTEDLRLTLLAPDSQAWQIKLFRDGVETNLRDSSLFIERTEGEVGLDGVKYPAEIFAFNYTKGGVWRIEINAPNSGKRDGETAGYLVVTDKSPYQIYTYLDTNQTLTGKSIGIATRVFDTQADKTLPEAIAGSVISANGELILPNGTKQIFALRDHGDGIFTTKFVPRYSGQYTAQITVRGITPNGESFIRTSETLIQVVGDNAKLGKTSYTNLIDDTRLQINLPVSGLNNGRKVIAYGEIWGENSSGEKFPVAWISGMTIAEGAKSRTTLPLVLDGRWLALADTKSNFELRNVRLQDADYFVTLAQSERIALTIPLLPEAAKSAVSVITDEMRTGKRPNQNINDAVGGKLMLVHGYCSGGNPFPTSQFASNIVFSDPNQNRTHDQFANLIRTFGAAYPSFGIVAHSQGGAASLHLYTYYWSGLDYATGGTRLIQSVGTPYQGTALAGNLALLGQIFGAGCGTNYDLSYSGAAAFLAGVPAWARAKVYYSTTSFTDVWYRYDYCNAGTDLFLSDPDDGVVERAYAQLPGANNRGHKTGWCHTGGMRDPAQTSDSSRNADMNANAAR